MVDSPSNRVCQRKIDIVVVFGRNFSFTIEIPNFMFTFIQQVNPLLKKWILMMRFLLLLWRYGHGIYDGPPSSEECVNFIEKTLLRTRETLAEALHDRAHAEREAKRWKIFGEFLF